MKSIGLRTRTSYFQIHYYDIVNAWSPTYNGVASPSDKCKYDKFKTLLSSNNGQSSKLFLKWEKLNKHVFSFFDPNQLDMLFKYTRKLLNTHKENGVKNSYMKRIH